MKALLRRLEKLEAAGAEAVDGPWLWPAKAARVRKFAMEAMASGDQIVLREVFADPMKSIGFTERHPELWDRYEETFERAVREVPAPCWMTASDMLGWD